MDVQEISLSEDGPDLSGRDAAAGIRETVRSDVDDVVFDCNGIESMSPSFADELFGKLAVQARRPERMRVANASPDVVSVIKFAIRERKRSAVKHES